MSYPRPRRTGGRARDAGRVADRPRIDGGRRSALQGGEGNRRQAGDRLRGVRHRRPQGPEEGLRPSHAARGRQPGLLEPDQALEPRLPRGLLLQAPRRLGAPRTARRRGDRAFRLPLGKGLQGARGEPPLGRARGARPARAGVRARLRLRRAPERPPGRPGADPAPARRARHRRGPPDGRHRRRPLPPARGRARPRGAALHPVRRLAEEPEPLEVRHRPLLLQDARGDRRRLPRTRRRAAAHARGRRALLRRDRTRPDPPAQVPGARRAGCLRLPRRALREGPREAVRVHHRRAHREAPLRAEDDPGDGVHRLLPHRLGLHPLREGARDLGRARPRLGCRQPRLLLPADHRPRPDPLRPALRAVPQPGPQDDARHGHRLRGGRARARHQLRDREVRP